MEPQELTNLVYEGKRQYIKTYPQHVVRASEIGHPCERYLVYSITNWADRKPYDPGLQFVFEGGNAVEELALKDFTDAGFKVYRPEPDKAIMESRPRITGHIDFRIDFGEGVARTVEVKGLNVLEWEKLNSIEDFFASKKPWIKKYPAQLMTYLYIKAEEFGYFYLKSIPRFKPKFIKVNLDFEYMESLLQKTERIEKHIATGTLPEQIGDPEICESCAFCHICLPAILREGLEFVDDNELLEMIERREQLDEAASEWEKLDKQIKEKLNKREKVCIGNYLIQGKWVERKGFTVKDSRYLKYSFSKIA